MRHLNEQKIAAMLAALSLYALTCAPAAAQDDGTDPVLTEVIGKLDQDVFKAYNRCDLKTFAAFFSPRVEFYHDKGGVTWDRASVVANTKKWICGKVRRELIEGSLRVYPIKDFGAVEEGEHRFCELTSGECEGIAKFLMIWRKTRTGWEMTRVVSFGHRPNPTR